MRIKILLNAIRTSQTKYASILPVSAMF